MKQSVGTLTADPREGNRVAHTSPVQEEASVGSGSSSALVRCGTTIHALDTPEWHPRPEGAPRRRCIHPKGHNGPHWFGDANA